MTAGSEKRILIVDDEPDFLASTRRLLKSMGYETYATEDVDFGLDLLDREQIDLVLCDLLMPGKDGISFLKATRAAGHRDLPIIMMSAYGTIDRAVASMKAGAFDFVEKPFDADHLDVVLDRALNLSRIISERDSLLKQLEHRYHFENIIGRSDGMMKIFSMIESVATSDASIMITGESGTGKELIARSIHARSQRRTRPFVPVNCGAFPEHLFESEVFGFEKGAFTGATERKLGLLEYAHTGTFFLDEVCELPVLMQAKFLRVLQERELRRLGGNDLVPVNVRVIASTNRDPEEEVEAKRFREDLYYRLNVIRLRIPPLRERREDIALLATHFMAQSIPANSEDAFQIVPETMVILEAYNWPGNVRELENTISRAVAMTRDNTIKPEDLPSTFMKIQQKSAGFEDVSFQQARKHALERVEKQYLLFLLQKHNGNITHLAREAGMSRRNAYRLLDKYTIDISTSRS